MAITLKAHTGAVAVTGGGTFTSSAIDTTGANLIVINLAGFPGTLTDSKGNTWVLAVANGTNAVTRLWYSLNPIVGTGHTFTVSGSGISNSMQVAAFAGVINIDGTSSNGGGTSASGLTPGPLTPSTINELFVTGYEKENTTPPFTIDSLFTITDQITFDAGTGHFGGALAWKLSSSAENPFWGDGAVVAGRNGATMATFTSSPVIVPVVPPVVQAAVATSAAGPSTLATMPLNVTAGNFLIVMTGHPGGNECGTSVFTDTRGLTFTNIAGAENVSGGQSNSCIYMAPITSSGPETITRTIASSNYPNAMFVAEIAASSAPVVDSASGGTADGGTTVNSGGVTSAHTNLILVGVGSDSSANPFTSATPIGGTQYFLSPQGAFLIIGVGAGTYSATFNKTVAGARFSAAAALISFTAAITHAQIGFPSGFGV